MIHLPNRTTDERDFCKGITAIKILTNGKYPR